MDACLQTNERAPATLSRWRRWRDPARVVEGKGPMRPPRYITIPSESVGPESPISDFSRICMDFLFSEPSHQPNCPAQARWPWGILASQQCRDSNVQAQDFAASLETPECIACVAVTCMLGTRTCCLEEPATAVIGSVKRSGPSKMNTTFCWIRQRRDATGLVRFYLLSLRPGYSGIFS